ncbi:MAG TPA: Hsp20 family protein [Candidatus Saccharimonadales bacterium]|jgi:HSP20 family protein|nr:Hsp20 family protein [Candidatus Saccharimonadales bacterium]
MTAQSATAMRPAKGSVPVHQNPDGIFEQFDRVYESIARRAFELFQTDGRVGRELDDWLRAEAELLHPTHLVLTESDGNFILRAEVPGFTAKDLGIEVEPRHLRIMGKREAKEEKNARKIRSEWCADQILRAVDLPADVDTARVNASLKDGILTIDLPKAAHAKAIHVEPRPA